MTESLSFHELRQRLGMSVEEVAQEVDCDLSTVYRWDRGETAPKAYVYRSLEMIGQLRPEAGSGSARRGSLVPLHRSLCRYRRATYWLSGHRWPLCFHIRNGTRIRRKPIDVISATTMICMAMYGSFRKTRPDSRTRCFARRLSVPALFNRRCLEEKCPWPPSWFPLRHTGTLFFDTAQIIAHHKPAAFVLENVKNLERHDKGKTFATIMNVLQNELGYHVQSRVISSAPWVPQNGSVSSSSVSRRRPRLISLLSKFPKFQTGRSSAASWNDMKTSIRNIR